MLLKTAIANARKLLIHDHIDECLKYSFGTSTKAMQAMITEFNDISKYLYNRLTQV